MGNGGWWMADGENATNFLAHAPGREGLGRKVGRKEGREGGRNGWCVAGNRLCSGYLSPLTEIGGVIGVVYLSPTKRDYTIGEGMKEGQVDATRYESR